MKKDPRMMELIGYSEFKRKLTTKPKWVARAIMVLTLNPHLFGLPLEITTTLIPFALEIQQNGGLDLPWPLDSPDGRDAVKLVRKFAPKLYKYSKQKEQEKLDREAAA